MSHKSEEPKGKKGSANHFPLEKVKQFLQQCSYPRGCSATQKRTLRRRAKSFVLLNNELYFAGGRKSASNSSFKKLEENEEVEPELEPDLTQVLRKVLLSAEEQQEAVDKAHIGKDGTHYGMDKTRDLVSRCYYWQGIKSRVCNTIRACMHCSSRSKTDYPRLSYGHGLNFGPESAGLMVTDDFKFAVQEKGSAISNISDDSISADSLPIEMVETRRVTQELGSRIEQDVCEEMADGFSMAGDICSYFWQKVEIQLFGPYQADGKQIFVAVALDSYSQFPEAMTMEVLSPASLTSFVLNLFCRYGVMEKLSLLQNQVTRNKEIFLRENVLQAGISPTVLFPHVTVSPLGERWKHIEKSLNHFVGLYPEFWFYCLEAFMVPLRIALPAKADYSPYFLAHGREPTIPDELSKLCGMDTSVWSEVRLTEKQERETVEMVTAAYGINSDTPSVPVTLEGPPAVTRQAPAKTMPTADNRFGNTTVIGFQWKKHVTSNPSIRESVRLEEEKTENCGERKEQGMEMEEQINVQSDSDDGFTAFADGATYTLETGLTGIKSSSDQLPFCRSNSHRPANSRVLKANIVKNTFPSVSSEQDSPLTSKGNSLSAKENIHFSCMQDNFTSSEAGVTMNAFAVVKNCTSVSVTPLLGNSSRSSKMKHKQHMPSRTAKGSGLKRRHFTRSKKLKMASEKNISVIKSMQQLPLDTFYFILKQYKEHGEFPPDVSWDAKNSIVHLSEIVDVQDGKMYSCIGKTAGRLIISGEKARIGVLQKAHVRGEKHYSRTVVLNHLKRWNVFWMGMSMDLVAFIHACPVCASHNPLHNKAVVQVPSRSAVLSLNNGEEDDPHLSEDEEEENSYEELLQYLTDGTFPDTATLHQQSLISQRSEKFCIINGCLFYGNIQERDGGSDVSQPRQVLISDKLRQSAMEESHIEDGHHLSQQDTQAKLRAKYFWSSMTFDVMAYVMECCNDQCQSADVVVHRNPIIQDRVIKLLKYYKEKMVPKLDTRFIRGTNTHLKVNKEFGSFEMDESKGIIQTPRSITSIDEGTKIIQEEDEVTRAVEYIIADYGKSLRASVEGKQENTDSEGGIIERKQISRQPSCQNVCGPNVHTCQHCGKFICGSATFKRHLNKHMGLKPFRCTICNRSFTTRNSLQIHTRKHTGVRPYLCNQCGRGFFRRSSFRYHIIAHNKTKRSRLPCDQCNREFRTQKQLDTHKEFKHPAEPKLNMCTQCGKVFTAARSLKRHEQTHTGARNHQCHFCSRAFFRKEYLNSHLSSHPEHLN